ncbi:hypothetical protein WJX81_004293 [Elliptochloris bilobata]|uniref:DUF4336 domain-containing protein n=1 Tax=Elliptochloris bilobata TaxID=381761 RepID=A0AAW1SL46_9CHLO
MAHFACSRRNCRPEAGGQAPTAARKAATGGRRDAGKVELMRHEPHRPGGTRDDGREHSPGRFYFAVTGFPFPLGPLLERRTVRYEVERGSMWVFEQEQSLANSTATNVRMVAIRLASGGLWIHAPIAPTRECVALVRELPGEVEHIVLPTFAVEHKQFVGPFSRAFPKAAVHVAPRQWSWPLWLPVQFLGIFPKSVLRDSDTATPWAGEIEQKIFSSAVGIGPYQEVAFFHRRSRTLLVTDAVIFVPPAPPEVVRAETLMDAGGELPASVRTFGSDAASELGDTTPPPPPAPPPADPDARQQLGWQRMALQILYFIPGNLQAPAASFDAIVGRLLVSPVLQVLVFGNARQETRRWVDDIVRSWDFRRIIPCHFAAPVRAGPREFRAAFDFAYEGERNSERTAVRGGILARLFRARSAQAAAVELPAGDIGWSTSTMPLTVGEGALLGGGIWLAGAATFFYRRKKTLPFKAAYFFAWPTLGVATVLIMQPSGETMKQALKERGRADEVRLAYERQTAQSQLDHLKAAAEEGKTKTTW